MGAATVKEIEELSEDEHVHDGGARGRITFPMRQHRSHQGKPKRYIAQAYGNAR